MKDSEIAKLLEPSHTEQGHVGQPTVGDHRINAHAVPTSEALHLPAISPDYRVPAEFTGKSLVSRLSLFSPAFLSIVSKHPNSHLLSKNRSMPTFAPTSTALRTLDEKRRTNAQKETYASLYKKLFLPETGRVVGNLKSMRDKFQDVGGKRHRSKKSTTALDGLPLADTPVGPAPKIPVASTAKYVVNSFASCSDATAQKKPAYYSHQADERLKEQAKSLERS